MAAELIGTAYVRIKAVTAGLASEIQDGVDKGVKDAKLDKAGEALGEDLGEGASKSFKGSMADGVTDAFDSPALHKASKDGGAGVAKDVSEGVEKENKRNNPFGSMLDSLKRLSFKDAFRGKFDGARDEMRTTFDGLDLDFGGGRDFDLGDFIDIPGLEDDGEKAGDAVTRGVEKSHKKRNPFRFLSDSLGKINLPKPIEWAGIFGPTTIAPIIGGILSLLALVVQGLGFIVVAAAGAGAALAGIAAVALPGLGALFAAFKTNTKRLEQFKKRAKELLKPWEEFGIATQEHLLPGLESFLGSISLLIPKFRDFGSQIGRTFGDFAKVAGETLTSEKNVRALGVVLNNSSDFFRNMTTAAGSFIDLLLPFLSAVAPLAVQFSESLAKWAAHLAEIVNTDFETEDLADRFQGWYDKLSLVVGIVGDVLVGLWGIFSLASDTPQAGGLFDTLASAAQTFRDWVGSTEGQNKIKAFFDAAQPVLDEIWRLLQNVYNLIVAPTVEGDGGAAIFSNLAWALDLLNDVLENPTTKTVVPYLLSLVVGLTLLSQLATPLGLFATALGGVTTALGFVGGPMVRFASGLTGIGSATGVFATLGQNLAIAGSAIGITAGSLLAFAAAVGVAAAVWIFWDDIVAGLEAAWKWFVKLETPMQVFVAALVALGAALVVIGLVALGPLGALIAGLVGLVVVIKNWSTIAKYLDIAWDAIYEFFTKLPGLIGDALGAIGDFLLELPGKLGEFGTELIAFFAGLPGQIQDLLVAGFEALPKLILDALAELGSLGLTLLGWIADGLIAAAPVIGEWFIKLPLLIIDWVFTAVSDLIGIGLDIIMWIINGLAEALPDIIAWFVGLPFEILTVVRRIVADLVEAGVEMVLALIRGLVEERHRIFDWFHDLPGNILEAIAATAEFLWDFGKGLITGMWNGIQEMWPTITSFFSELPGKILDFLDAAWDFLFDIGEDLMNGLWDGINSVWDSIDEFFGELPGEIGGFFKDLPGIVGPYIEDFVTTAVDFFIGLPGQILTALLGLGTTLVTTFASAFISLVTALPRLFLTVGTFFLTLPFKILGLVMQGLQSILYIGEWLIENIVLGLIGIAQTLWDFFTGLPQAIIDLVVAGAALVISIGGSIIGWIVEGLITLGTTLWDWITGLPQAMLDLLITVSETVLSIGSSILGWIVDGITGAAQALWDWITGLPQAMLDLLIGISQQVIDIGGAILGWIRDGLVAAWNVISTYITELPGNFLSGLENITSEFLDIGESVIGWIVDGLGKAWDIGGDIWQFIKDIPGEFLDVLDSVMDKFVDIGGDIVGWIVDGFEGLGSAMLRALKGAWNYVAERFDVVIPIPFRDDIVIELPKFAMAMGGIIPGSALGTTVTVGEGGRSEAIIPITRPSRALALMQEAGLDRMVLDAYMGGSVGAGNGVVGETTMLHIDTAYMTAPVDADMIVQKVTSAYNRLAS